MAYNMKNTVQKPERLSPGHRMCAGCAAPVVVRTVLRALEEGDEAVITSATGCLEVSTFIYPYTSWKDSFIHSAFENASATTAGIEAAYRYKKKMGRLEKDYKFITFGGDGGTYDIGLQSLSGAMERGHDMVYVCYDNGAYMNTGIQRSSATPRYADTTTTPSGTQSLGKGQPRKDITGIMAAHRIPYTAQSALTANMKDLYEKSQKAIYTQGPAFLNVLAPCPRGWRYDTPKLLEISKIAVDTCYWPLFEVEGGKYTLNYRPKNKRPISDWLEIQGRFRHILKKPEVVEEIQKEVDKRWEELLKLSGN